jgi:hypothetical protein
MKKETAIFEIILLVSMSIAFSYIMDSADKQATQKEPIIKTLGRIIANWLNEIIPSVSAESAVSTCVHSKTNKTCQEYLTTQCASICDGSCVPSTVDKVADCKPGTCYDSQHGICQSGSPAVLCNADGGTWYNDPYGNIAQCNKGCCILGNNAVFMTAGECSEKSVVLGFAKDFRPEIQTEIGCIALSNSEEEGACVYEEDYENTCKFTTKTICKSLDGTFYSGYLCSNPELKTNCKKQATAKCVDGKDGLYWFDSCGNRENIYSADKTESYNAGMILPEEKSCELGTGTNPLANQKTCGNCNYLLGSICGKATSTQKLADSTINFVCRDLSCTDDKGNKHKQGESWCAYEGRIGLDSVNNRATDTVGSRHFRQSCLDGEISTESCGDYRTGICVQSGSGSGQSSFSSAACRPNSAMECLNYNFNNEIDKCEQNSDCFIKHVQVGNDFKFDFCASKYPIGFDLTNDATSAQTVCGLASQSCTVTYVKKAKLLWTSLNKLTEWECKQNCECEKAAFAQQLNNLCMSLGDCGAKVNYVGKLSESYKVSNSAGAQPKLDNSYLTSLSSYKTPVSGQAIESKEDFSFNSALGIPSGLGNGSQIVDNSAAATSFALKTSGSMGVVLAGLSWILTKSTIIKGSALVLDKIPLIKTLVVATKFASTAGTTAQAVAAAQAAATEAASAATAAQTAAAQTAAAQAAQTAEATKTAATATKMNGYGGAFAGAAIGLAITSMLIKATGIGAGLSTFDTYVILAAGTYAGAMIGYAYASHAASLCATGAGCIVAVVVLVVILVMNLLGVGKTKTVTVNFQCQPWQAPTGGADCAKCGSDNLPCSRYGCESLGQTCELVNEGTDSIACINNNKNDVTPPIITPNEGDLQDGYNIEPTENGFRLNGPEGCLKAYSPATFGITTNEASQCRYDTLHTTSFDSMEFDFGGSNLYTINHTSLITLPDLASLGLPNYDPNARGDYAFYVRCRDKNGRFNANEYVINFCLKPGDDVTPPLMTRGEPILDYVPYGTTSQAVVVYTNEPAECRWNNYDMKYDLMTNQFTCANDIAQQTMQGWKCGTAMPLPQQSNKFYVRCLDKPWENDTSKRNANTQSLSFTLKKTGPLNITSLTPSGETLKFGNVSSGTVTIEAETTGGYDGTATCYIEFNGNYVMFDDTGSTEHSQMLNQLTEGEKQLNVRCIDSVGNAADKSSNFTVIIDNTSPEITRVYADNENLVIITNENSECYFNKQACNYEIGNATEMSGSGLEHTTGFDSDFDYYIKCSDEMGNVPGDCSIIVRKGVIS